MFWIAFTFACAVAFYAGYEFRRIVSAANRVKEQVQERQGEPLRVFWYFGVVRRTAKVDGGMLVVFEDGKTIVVPGADPEFAPTGKIVKIYNGCLEEDILKGHISN